MNMKFILLGFIALWAFASCSEKPLDNQSTETELDQPRLKAASLNYYVSTSGSDTNPGTSAAPFRTIQKAANVVNPGDTVIIRNGVYSTTSQYFINVNRGGAAGAYVTFKAENKWGAVLDGGNVSSYGISLGLNVSYVQFVDLEIKNFLWMGIFCNNGTSYSNYITVKGCKIHDIGRVFDQGDYGRCAIYFSRGNHHWTITQNYIYNTGRTNTTDNFRMNKDHAVYIGTANTAAEASHHNVITYNVMYSTSGNTLNIGSYSDLIANNVSAFPNKNLAGGSCFIVSEGAGGYNLTIANNIIYGLDPRFAFAIVSHTGYSGWVVKNNIVHNGTMWANPGSGQSAMAGNNYGLTDCERSNVDPQFMAPALPTADFRLKSTSPAINAGASVGLTVDILGKSMSGTPDIGSYEYGAVAPTPTPTTYYNKAVSSTASKNDCPSGSTGSTVTYTVAAGKYSSTISQADADTKASADLSANTQTYANSNGTCTAAVVYYSKSLSATATKNDCPTGSTGSTVTYSVAAGKYSSTISQADADSKATADLNANTQTYANNNGTCTAVVVYYSKALSASATKNNCPTGYTGSTVTYSVAAGKYSSTLSQADADSKAAADLSANTQTYANNTGTCTAVAPAPTVYYNSAVSATVLKNNCPRGYKGSYVTYTVAAKKYSSTVSQADADAKAQNDLDINKQVYANDNGTCTRGNKLLN